MVNFTCQHFAQTKNKQTLPFISLSPPYRKNRLSLRPPASVPLNRVLLLFLYFTPHITVNARSYLQTRAIAHLTACNQRSAGPYMECYHSFFISLRISQ